MKKFRIKFDLPEDILKRGVDPLVFIHDLARLGRVSVVANPQKIPHISDFSTDKLYLSFDITLETESERKEIEDVLLFIIDDGVEIKEDEGETKREKEEKKDVEEKEEKKSEEIPSEEEETDEKKSAVSFDFVEEIIKSFLEETEEHLDSIEKAVLELEKGDLSVINELFRGFHTIKGNSGLLAKSTEGRLKEIFSEIEDISHEIEDKLQRVRDEGEEITEEDIDKIFHAVDIIRERKKEIELIKERGEPAREGASDWREQEGEKELAGGTGTPEEQMKEAIEILKQKIIHLEDILKKIKRGEEPEEAERVFTQLQRILSSAGIMQYAELMKKMLEYVNEKKTEEYEKALKLLKSELTATKIELERTVRIDIKYLDELVSYVNELVVLKDKVESIDSPSAREVANNLSNTIRRLQMTVIDMRMLPVKIVFSRFPRIVRDIAKTLNKKVKFRMEGEETRIDKSLIDKIGDPLIHIIRNAIDHGIEPADVRRKLGKSEEGNVVLRAYNRGEQVIIEVEDDGAGINEEKIIEKAKSLGMKIPERREDVINLIFEPGFSTADKVSELSGRGVGLDVVKKIVEDFGGKVAVETERGKGTKFSLMFPLSVALTRVFCAEVGGIIFGFPERNVLHVLKTENLNTFLDSKKIMKTNYGVIRVLELGKIFNINSEGNHLSYVIILNANKIYGVAVEKVIGIKDAYIRPKSAEINAEEISSLAIISGGKIVYIVDPERILSSQRP